MVAENYDLRRQLDERLSSAAFETAPQPTREVAVEFFRELFVRGLGFEATEDDSHGSCGTPEDDDRKRSWGTFSAGVDVDGLESIRQIATGGDLRILYVELDTLSRHGERAVVTRLADAHGSDDGDTDGTYPGDWATDGTYLAVFHAPDADVWHLVTPYEPDAGVTAGRPLLRRYTLGAGGTHRTVADALDEIDASRGDPVDGLDEAFSVDRVTERFYREYGDAFETVTAEYLAKGLEGRRAERYAHLTLNRLLCVRYLQAGGWLDGRRRFLDWFLDRYDDSESADQFHGTWLSALFFRGLGTSPEGAVESDQPSALGKVLSGIDPVSVWPFQWTELDETGTFLSDATVRELVTEFLGGYNFTARERTPYDVDVAVGPAMLGRIYESLVAQRDRDEAGIFYTPDAEIDLICRLALYEQFREHAHAGTDSPERPVSFLFAESAEWDRPDPETVAAWETVLDDIRIVDPACGSGAFLVGMKQVLAELYRKLGRSGQSRVAERIVTESLAGVDVKEWGVHVAEFRLWLSTLEATGRGSSPVLDGSPNLATGDSLVPPSGTGSDPTMGPASERDRDDGRFVWERAYPDVMSGGGFDVVIGNPPYVRQEDIFDQRLESGWLGETTSEAARDRERAYETRLREYVTGAFGVEPYRTSDLYLYFFFRSLDLLCEGGTLSFLTSNSWLDVDYGIRLQECLLSACTLEYVLENRATRTFEKADVNTVIAVVTREGTDELSGRPAFLSTTTAYRRLATAETMQPVLGDSRTRDQRGVPRATGTGDGETLSFQGETLQVRQTEAWRSISLSAAALWRLGGGQTSDDAAGITRPRGRYRSGKWGKYTRAPTVFFEVAGRADRKLVPLGEECEVRRGIRTGANQFFYLPSKYYEAAPDGETLVLQSTGEWPDDDYETELRIPREYWMHRTEEGWEPNLVLKSSKSFDTTMFGLDALELGDGLRYLLLVDEPKPQLEDDVRAYVEWGETYDPGEDDLGGRTTSFPSSVSARGVAWYDLSADLRRGDVLPMKNIDTRHVYWVPERGSWIDDRLHGIELAGDDRRRLVLAGILNSTYGTLSCEVNGRVNLGKGALDVTSSDHERTLIPPLERIDDALQDEIADAFEAFAARPVRSLFEELGATGPGELSFDGVAPDRLHLDRVVIRELLGFDEETHRRVYEGTLALVRQRIEKAPAGNRLPRNL